MRVVFFFTVILFFAASCTKNNVYENNKLISLLNWKASDTLSYKITVTDTSYLYNIYINVRHTEDYPYKNIWLMIYTTFPGGKTLSKRTELDLADEDGKWYGQGVNNIWDDRILLQNDAYFNTKGQYSFALEQDMRQDPLPGIMAVGIRIENTGVKKSAMPMAKDSAATSN